MILDEEVSADALAALTNMSRRWVFDRATDGTITRVGRGKFRLGDALPALIEHMNGGDVGDELQKSRLRKLNADADRAEFELKVRRGEYAPIHEFEMVTAAKDAVIRQNVFYNLPKVAWLALCNEKDETRWKEGLKDKIRDALQQSAEADLSEYLEQPEATEGE